MRSDGTYIDFEDVGVGTILLINVNFVFEVYMAPMFVHPGDICHIVELRSWPRQAKVVCLRTQEYRWVRVDALLELDDEEAITIGPGARDGTPSFGVE